MMSYKARRVAERLNLEGRAWSRMELCAMAGVSLRQLMWWEARGVVAATISASAVAFYDERDSFRVLLVAELRNKGVSLQRVRGILRGCFKREPAGHLLLVSDPAELFGSQEALVFALVDSEKGGLVIDLSELEARLFEERPAPPPKPPHRVRRPRAGFELSMHQIDRMHEHSLRGGGDDE